MSFESLFSLQNKHIIVTGGARGIGAAIVKGLKNAGALVSVFDKESPSEKLSEVFYHEIDLSDQEKLSAVFQKTLHHHPSIHALVNCAGITLPESSEAYTKKNWEITLDINLSAVFYLCQKVGKQMIQQGTGGSIINITSIGAERGFPNNPGYAATKGGVKQLTKALAVEWGKYNIRVNNLAPGYTHTPMNNKSWHDEGMRQARAERTALGRWASPEEMIGPIIFLCSDASSYVTGIDLYVDGGWIAKGF